MQVDTLTDQAVDAVREMLESGELGEPIPPERPLAKLLGISRVTMRRAIAVLEESGLIRRSQGSGTFSCFGPDIVSTNELLSVQGPFLVVLTEQEGDRFNPQITPWTWQICRHLTTQLSQDKVQMYFVNSREFLSEAVRSRLESSDLVGFIAPTHLWNSETYEEVMGLGMPFVGLGRTTKSTYWNIIDLDHRAGLRDAFQDIRPKPDDRVFIPLEAHPLAVDRQMWFEHVTQELSRCGLSANQIVVKPGGMFETQGFLATKWYLREYEPPTIILADFDLCIVGAYRALMAARESGTIRASDLQNLRCLGGGDLLIGRSMTPVFSSLDMDCRLVASAITQMLQEQGRTKQPAGLRYVESRYIARSET